jgi:hypothetical protein
MVTAEEAVGVETVLGKAGARAKEKRGDVGED